MKVTVENNELVIRMPLEPSRPSKTGKTRIVASTSGFVATDAVVAGKPLSVAVNAVIR